ncbi:hypothetical protein [Massilia sp. Root335]|uniref:hypothetical protein n=1 Tax=Massilia sp. Root335 TaxID=1736517 RepID=UPI0006F281E5|nr:hypothetical protein [Massilia sp. Root335]KQV51818.1 hypothetical protein ASC93_07775 [Massilia sp. Root335]
MKFEVSAIALGCIALLSGCGGGSGGSGNGGLDQTMTFPLPFAGQAMIGVPPNTATATLTATASSGATVTYTSNTPTICSVSGDQLSLLKAGECSVTATQAGSNGYAPVSQRQIIVVPKNPQVVAKFPNPGWQPVGAAPVQLAASFNSGLPVTFTSKTPNVCSVSGTTMTTLADGMCTVTAQQAGNDVYAATAVDRNIPVGTEKPAMLNFASGYKDNTSTKEGLLGHLGNQWWCQQCDIAVPGDGSSLTFTTSFDSAPQPSDWNYNSASFWMFGAGILDASDLYSPDGTYQFGVKASALSDPSKPKGAQIDIQSGLHFNLAQNPEWFGAANNKFNVELTLGHFNLNKVDAKGNACAVTLQATVQPAAAAAADYSIGLKDQFTISQTCDLTGLDLWDELQHYPVVKLRFTAVQPNAQVANASGKYVTQFKLTGPIYFQ